MLGVQRLKSVVRCKANSPGNAQRLLGQLAMKAGAHACYALHSLILPLMKVVMSWISILSRRSTGRLSMTRWIICSM